MSPIERTRASCSSGEPVACEGSGKGACHRCVMPGKRGHLNLGIAADGDGMIKNPALLKKFEDLNFPTQGLPSD